jgi:hypothetical protein
MDSASERKKFLASAEMEIYSSSPYKRSEKLSRRHSNG